MPGFWTHLVLGRGRCPFKPWVHLQLQHQHWGWRMQPWGCTAAGLAGRTTRSLSWRLVSHAGLAESSITHPSCPQLGQQCCGRKCKLPCRDALDMLRRQLPITASRLAARRKAQAADSQLEAEQVGFSPVTVPVSLQRAGFHLRGTNVTSSDTACAVH